MKTAAMRHLLSSMMMKPVRVNLGGRGVIVVLEIVGDIYQTTNSSHSISVLCIIVVVFVCHTLSTGTLRCE